MVMMKMFDPRWGTLLLLQVFFQTSSGTLGSTMRSQVYFRQVRASITGCPLVAAAGTAALLPPASSQRTCTASAG